jgi:hypothetical protein
MGFELENKPAAFSRRIMQLVCFHAKEKYELFLRQTGQNLNLKTVIGRR